MYDGADGEAIAARRDDLEAGLAAYEEAMFARSAKAAAEAAAIHRLCYGDGAPRGLIDLFTGARPPTA